MFLKRRLLVVFFLAFLLVVFTDEMGSNVVIILFVALLFICFSAESFPIPDSDVVQRNSTEQPEGIPKDELFSNAIPQQECRLPPDLIREIDSYKPIVQRIINEATNGVFKGRTWRTLAKFVDSFGSRIAGSDNLERSIDYMVELLNKNELENVHTEPALVPKWVRGHESSWLVKPRLQKLSILGLGYSIATPSKGIIANAVVVNSFEELKEKGEEVIHTRYLF